MYFIMVLELYANTSVRSNGPVNYSLFSLFFFVVMFLMVNTLANLIIIDIAVAEFSLKKKKAKVAHIILALCWFIILVIVGPIIDPDPSFGLCGTV